MPTPTTTCTPRTRYYAVTLLGLSSGLPISLSSSTLQAWFTEDNIGLIVLGLLNIVGLPYVFKVVMGAPVGSPHFIFFGTTQELDREHAIGLNCGVVVDVLFASGTASYFIDGLRRHIGLFSSTQDIAVDAYRTEILRVKERGLGSALNVTGYRFALLIAGAMALLLADHIGWGNTYRVMAGILLACSILTFFTPEPCVLAQPKSMKEAFWGPLRDFLSRPNAIALIFVVILYKLGDAYALSLTTPFLLRGLQFTLTEVALLNKVIGLSAVILGGVAGGLWMMRLGLFRSLFVFGILAALTNILFVVLALVGKNMTLAGITIFFENFCSGMSSAAFVAFLMALCNPKFTAMQYACLSAVASIGRVLIGSTSGILVHYLGWANFYWVSAAICVPGLYLLWYSHDMVCFKKEDALAEVV